MESVNTSRRSTAVELEPHLDSGLEAPAHDRPPERATPKKIPFLAVSILKASAVYASFRFRAVDHKCFV